MLANGVVRGKLVNDDGAALNGVSIELFAKSIRSEMRLGGALTSIEGQYSITYLRPVGFNLVARAIDASGKTIARSITIFSAAEETEIDLTTAKDGVIRTPSTFSNIETTLTAQLSETPLSDLKENKDTREVQFLANATGIPFKQVAYRFIAHVLGPKNKINEATLFGIFYQGIPPSLSAALTRLPDGGIDEAFTGQVLSAVLAHSRSMLEEALAAAVKANVLPASYAAVQASELTALDALRADGVRNAPYMRGKTSLNDLLDAAGVPDPAKTAFIQTYADRNGRSESTWATLRARTDLAPEHLALLETTLSTGEHLSGNLPLVKDTLARIAGKTLAGLQDLALLDESDWTARISSVDPQADSITQVLADDTPTTKTTRFAKALTERFAAKYPTTTFAGRLSKAQTSSFVETKDELVAFLTANPTFTFQHTNVDHFLVSNKLAVSAPALADIKLAQRLTRVCPHYESVEALRKAGHNSAQSVCFAGRQPFLTEMATALGGASAAKLAYARAQMTSATALAAYGSYNLALNGTNVAALASAVPNPTALTNLPDLQALFGSLDYFECADCQSVLSPAAYLVDLLQYLGQIAAVGFPVTTPPIPANACQALFMRRPDIQHVTLSCNNTNITLPYIDLVNEILESAIAPPATPVSVIETIGTSDERRAIPQNTSQAAYALTAGAVFPLSLPFDLAFARTTAYINALGITRTAFLTLFAGNPPAVNSGAAIAGASLGINPEMLTVITGADTHNAWDRWGLAQNPQQVIDPKTRSPYSPLPTDWVAALNKVPLLLNRAGLTIEQLYQLLEVAWVTQSSVTLQVGTTTSGAKQIVSPDTDLMVFTGLTADVLDRANRFLRLWKASGLQMWELDWAIEGYGGLVSGSFLSLLAGAVAVQSRLNLPFQEVLGFWAPLETRDVVSHLGDEDAIVPSTYSEVFRNPAVQLMWSGVFLPLNRSVITTASNGPAIMTALPHGYQTGMQVSIVGTMGTTAVKSTFIITTTGADSFILDGFTGTGAWTAGGIATGLLSGNVILSPGATAPTPEQNSIAASLSLNADDISAILAFTQAENTLSLPTLGVLLNYQRLSASLSLDIPDLILWIQLTGGTAFGGTPTAMLEFLRRFDQLQETGLAAEDLDYLLRDGSANQSSLAFTPAQATAILQTVRDALAKLTPGYVPGAIETIFVTALSTATGATANVVTTLLLKTSVLPLTSAIISLLVSQDSGVDPTKFPTLIAAFTSVAKAATLFKALKPSETEFAFVVNNSAAFNWLDPTALPVLPVTNSPYVPFEALVRALKLNRRQPALAPSLFDVLSQWIPPNAVPATLTAAIYQLSVALHANVNDLTAIATALGATTPSLTLPTQTGSLADMAMLAAIARALDVAARYRMSGATLVQLATAPATAVTASTAMAILQAQYPQSAWLGAIRPVEDALRRNRRDALVAYILGPGPAQPAAPAPPIPLMLTTDDIFDYYLIDPEMDPCASMTRLLQPSLAIQQFVQQCFLKLTFLGITVPMTSSRWSEWPWRQQYRLWQANREVFLYPENYVLPETRMDASAFFSELESDLRQTNADTENAESAIENYLRKLVNVSRLHVAAHYNETKPDQSTVLHVFARTRVAPWQWYYRKRTGMTPGTGSWSAWEQLNLDIASQHVVPFAWDGRLYLLWAVFTQTSERAAAQEVPEPDPKTGAYPAQQPPAKFWAIQFAMSELSAGQWQAKRMIENKVFVADLDDPHYFTFRALQDPSFNLQIQVYSSAGLGSAPIGSAGLIAVATLPFPDSPASVLELTNIPPSSNIVDTSQEPTFNLISIGTVSGEISTPTRYIFSGQDLTYEYDDDPPDTPEKLNVLCTLGASGGSITIGSIELLGKITRPRVVYPQQEAKFDSLGPFFVDDTSRTYLVQPHYYVSSTGYQEIPNHLGATQWYTRYAFQTFYHPFARTFLRQLETGGVPSLMSRSLQVGPQDVRGWGTASNFNFGAQYSPGAQVKVLYPGDPPLFYNPDPGESALDFAPGSSGAYSLYNWEIFYHVPMFVASLLMQNQQYQDALTWLEYIFDPTDSSSVAAPQCFWQMAPFYAMQASDWLSQQIENILSTLASAQQQGIVDSAATAAITNWIANPFDPHAVASLRISAYAKATVMKVLDVLIAWGDSYYSQYTAETVNQAEQLYIVADLILGPGPQPLRPPRSNQSGTGTATYASLQTVAGFANSGFSNVLVNIENVIVAPEPPQALVNGAETMPSLQLLPGNANGLLFCVPPNQQLLTYWDTVSQRLDNVRNCRNLQGVAQPLPLYAPAINPLLLVEAQAGGGSFVNLMQPAPIYRFATCVQKALELTNDVRAYGSLILSAIEKQDAETLSVLRTNQEIDIQTRMLDVKTAQVTEAQDQIAALQNQKAVVQSRYSFYSNRVFMNAAESTAISLQQNALVLNEVALILDITAGFSHLFPKLNAGVSGLGTPVVTGGFGGDNLGHSSTSWADVSRGLAGILAETAGIAATTGGYQRRMDEWQFQATLATGELAQIDNQIAAANQRYLIANKEVEIQKAQVSNAQAVSSFLANKYTNVQLYSWMVSQLTTVYTQAYQCAFSLALQAQSAYQYEFGVSDTFIQSGYWDSQHKGLTAGESLIFDLRRMQAQYIAANGRELELTKHISLVLTAPMALVMLRETGTCQIALDELLFESDHPGQYFRRLRSVALTIPCVTGPYTGVNATLSLTSAMVRTKMPDAGYVPQSSTAPPNASSVNFSPVAAAGTQIIATSSGQNDAGLFDVNLRDERWLPFEGQGAISTWNLTLDPRDNNFDFSTISDVVLHIRYTARGGGDQTAKIVRGVIKSMIETSRSILVGVRSTFGNAWYSFFNPVGPAGVQQTLTLPLTNVVFPYSNLGSGVKITGIAFYIAQSGVSTGSVAAKFGQTAGALQSFTLALGATSVAPFAGPLATPQSFTLTVPAGSLDPTTTEDILLVVNYSID